MKLYSKSGNYIWEFDRFHFFTESEKSSLSAALEFLLKRFKNIDDFNEEGGMNEMIKNMMNELDKSLSGS
ncbi:hypothetical protein LCGC14_0223100 [marine sediment metagenome]|uniref:Uncharacterized protein n=1 Tax=marine sediment metagenome TaxID=412755 RepID=A0A0F9UT89_9ZZZZ|nr:hypothetical protein [bacterium]